MGISHPIHIPMNSSFPTPPFPSKSNSSIMAVNSSSSSASPSSLATLLKSSILMMPLSSVSNRAKALSISSFGSLCAISVAAIDWNDCSVSINFPTLTFCGGLGFLAGGWGAIGASFGIPLAVRRASISDLGRSKPNAFRATLNSW
jgi:hypothetical protein